jgi:hypothetical protein
MEESDHLPSDDAHHLPACCEPKVHVAGDVPVDIIPSVTRCVIDMTEEERDNHFKEIGEQAYKHYLIAKASGAYSRCHKTDWCKVEREKKEQQQATLIQRNQLLEERLAKLEQMLERIAAPI